MAPLRKFVVLVLRSRVQRERWCKLSISCRHPLSLRSGILFNETRTLRNILSSVLEVQGNAKIDVILGLVHQLARLLQHPPHRVAP